MGFAEHEIQSGACLPSRLEGMNQALPSNQTLKLHLEWALGTAAFVELAAVVPQGWAPIAVWSCPHPQGPYPTSRCEPEPIPVPAP